MPNTIPLLMSIDGEIFDGSKRFLILTFPIVP